jgi:hypothetical protein
MTAEAEMAWWVCVTNVLDECTSLTAQLRMEYACS